MEPNKIKNTKILVIGGIIVILICLGIYYSQKISKEQEAALILPLFEEEETPTSKITPQPYQPQEEEEVVPEGLFD